MSHIERNMRWLNDHRLIYRQLPTTDKPTVETKEYMFFEDGTHQCYELFRSKAKITTFKSLKWHLLVLWYLNPQLSPDTFEDLVDIICYKPNGFVSFNISETSQGRIMHEVYMSDLERPPVNKLRKVVFKPFTGLTKSEKLSIVGSLIGVTNKIHPDDIYDVMLQLHDDNKKITIKRVSELLNVSNRTIYRHMCQSLKKEKELLNQQL
tara:strand:+ start:261 stop:884 length:624 start_codon:yes stop_codon:yes gene_type:complete